MPQLVFGSHDAHLNPAALRDLRVSEHFLQRMIGQIRTSPLQVQQQPPRPEAGQCRLGGGVLLGSHKKIDVAVRPQAWLRIQASDGPAFREKRLDAGRAAASEDLGDRLIVHGGFEGVHAIGVVERRRRRQVPQLRAAHPPPTQSSRAGFEKACRGRVPLHVREIRRRRHGTPASGEDRGQPPPLLEWACGHLQPHICSAAAENTARYVPGHTPWYHAPRAAVGRCMCHWPAREPSAPGSS